MTTNGAVHLHRVKDDTMRWKAIYLVQGCPHLRVESMGDPWNPQFYLGWNLYEMDGLDRHLVIITETLPEMRHWIGKHVVNPQVNGHAKKTRVLGSRRTST